MKLLLVRHGATDWSASGRHTGRTDVPLSVRGEEEADAAGRAARAVLGDDFPKAVIFSSPLSRALETARRVVRTGREIRTSDELVEFDYGDYEGLTRAEIHERSPGWNLWTDGCPNGETPADVGARADRFLEGLVAVDAPVAVFAHGHLLRILAARAVGLSADHGRVLALDTAAVSLIEDDRGDRQLKLWNLDPTLIG